MDENKARDLFIWFLGNLTPAVALTRVLHLTLHLCDELASHGRDVEKIVYHWMLRYDERDDRGTKFHTDA